MIAEVGVVLTNIKFVGGLGTRFVVTAVDATDLTDVPVMLVAVAVNVYDVLAFRPVIINGLLVPFTIMAPGLLVIA